MLVGFRNTRVNLNQCYIKLRSAGCCLECGLVLGKGRNEEQELHLVRAGGPGLCAGSTCSSLHSSSAQAQRIELVRFRVHIHWQVLEVYVKMCFTLSVDECGCLEGEGGCGV